MLDIRDLSFAYGSRAVLNGIGCSARAGEVAGLVGPNGSGKTTLLKCIAGILSPQGSICVDGMDISSMSRPAAAKKIAYVPQHIPSHAGATVFETILMGRRPYLRWSVSAADEDRVVEAMQLLHLEGYALRNVQHLSGGERQRVMIARAIVQETPVLLLDEPTSSLDVRHQMEVLDLVLRLAKERSIAVLMAIHDLNLAARYADRLMILKQGRLTAAGRPEEVLTGDIIREVYGIEAVVRTDAGIPLVVPLRAIPSYDDSKSPGPDDLLSMAQKAPDPNQARNNLQD